MVGGTGPPAFGPALESRLLVREGIIAGGASTSGAELVLAGGASPPELALPFEILRNAENRCWSDFKPPPMAEVDGVAGVGVVAGVGSPAEILAAGKTSWTFSLELTPRFMTLGGAAGSCCE